MNVTAEQVRTQLAVMGYHDVPDSIIQEFLRELQEPQQQQPAVDRRAPAAKPKASEPAAAPSSLLYPTAAGRAATRPSYRDDDEDEQLDDDLDAAYARMGLGESSRPAARSGSQSQPGSSGKQQKAKKSFMDEDDEADEIAARWVLKGRPAERIARPSSAAPPRTPDLGQRRQTAEKHSHAHAHSHERERPFSAGSRHSAAPSSAPRALVDSWESSADAAAAIRAAPRPAGFKKSDPVSMYAARAAQWKADPFLSRRTSSSRPSTADARPASASGRRPQRNVWEGLPNYTAPTDKRRDDLRWEVRMQMMS
eukprot:tig00020746_g13648.t1